MSYNKGMIITIKTKAGRRNKFLNRERTEWFKVFSILSMIYIHLKNRVKLLLLRAKKIQ